MFVDTHGYPVVANATADIYDESNEDGHAWTQKGLALCVLIFCGGRIGNKIWWQRWGLSDKRPKGYEKGCIDIRIQRQRKCKKSSLK